MPPLSLFRRATRSLGLALLKSAQGPNDANFWRPLIPKPDTSANQPYAQVTWVHAGVRKVAQSLSQVPWGFYRLSGEPAGEKIGEDRHRVKALWRSRLKSQARLRFAKADEIGIEPVEVPVAQRLLDYPRPGQGTREFIQALTSWLLLLGEGIILKAGKDGKPVATPSIFPVELWVQPPPCVEPVVGQATRIVREYRIRTTTSQDTVPAHAVAFSKLFNPYSDIRGLGPIQAAKRGIQTDYSASGFIIEYLDNSMEPGVVISYPDISPEEAQNVARIFEERHMGSGKRYRASVISGGGTVTPFQVTNAGAKFLDIRGMTREEILVALGVPLSTIFPDAANFATRLEDKKSLWNETIIPIGMLLEDLLNDSIFGPALGYGAYFAFDWSMVKALLDDFTLKLAQAKDLQALGYPTNAINQRLELGMDELPWGDTAYMPFSMVPVNELSGDTSDNVLPVEEPEAGAMEEPEPEKCIIPARTVTKADERLAYWNLFIKGVFDPLESKAQSKAKRFINDMRIATLERFDAATGGKSHRKAGDRVSDEWVFIEQEAREQIAKLFKPLFQQMAETAGGQLAEQIGIPFDLFNPRIVDFLEHKENKVRDIGTRLRQDLIDTLADGLREGESIAQLRDRIKAFYNNAAKPAQTLRIARTETAQTVSGVRNEMMLENNLQQDWVTAGDENVRDSHIAFGNAGPKPIGFNYLTLIGEGGELTYPSDINGPAGEVINCRCVALPAAT